MQTWDQGTRRIYENLSANFRDNIYLNRPVRKVYRQSSHVVVEDEDGVTGDVRRGDLRLQCEPDADDPRQPHDAGALYSLVDTVRERTSQPYGCAFGRLGPSGQRSEALTTRSNHIEQYGARPDNYEITYIMHNQQPWANRSDKPCLVTYNPISEIDGKKIIGKWWVPTHRA